MAVNPSPWGPKPQIELSTGLPAVGGQLFFYVAGSTSTKQNTYTDSTGGVANTNPIVLDANGFPTNTQIWFTAGQSYKVVYAPAGDTDPPSSPIWTIDNLRGQNDTTSSVDQWVSSGITPTYVSGTSFTMAGDQTTAFHVGRRLKLTVTAGTVYGTIATSVFGALTTVTMTMDGASVLDSGLSASSLGLLTATSVSIPNFITAGTGISVTYSSGKPTIAVSGSSTPVTRGALAGMTLSTAGSSSTMSVAAGQATDSTNAAYISLGSAMAKTTSAFATGTGNGGLDTGAIANSTWYHFYAIDTSAGGAADVTFSTNATTPTLNGSYVGGKYRRIGSGKTNGSAQWVKFVQDGDDFTWDTPVMDSSVTCSATATSVTLASVPLGVRTKAIVTSAYSGGGNTTYMSDLSNSDLAPSLSAAPGSFSGNGAASASAGSNVGIYTNTSQQIRHRESSGTGTIIFVTIGWTDTRGRNA